MTYQDDFNTEATPQIISAEDARKAAADQQKNQTQNLLQHVCSRVSGQASKGEFEMELESETAEKLWGDLQNLGYKINAESGFLGLGKKHTLSWKAQ